jgi:hypothetical protein
VGLLAFGSVAVVDRLVNVGEYRRLPYCVNNPKNRDVAKQSMARVTQLHWSMTIC